jgi:hypothetical protein
MAETQLTAPVPTGLVASPPPGLVSDAQYRVLMAFMDTIVPSVQRQPEQSKPVASSGDGDLAVSPAVYSGIKADLEKYGTDTSTLDAYLDEKPSSIPLFGQLVMIVLGGLPEDARGPLLMVMGLLR